LRKDATGLWPLNAKTSGCTDDECCKAPTCASFTECGQTDATMLRANPSETVCPAGGCTTTVCCVNPTCASTALPCPETRAPRPDPETIRCASKGACSTDECCFKPTCATHICTDLRTLRTNAETIHCADDSTCTTDECCNPPTCDTFSCDDGKMTHKAAPHLLSCPNTGCSKEVCCQNPSCSSFPCVGREAKPNFGGFICASKSSCRTDECCLPPNCGSYDGCGDGKELRVNAQDLTCSQGGCVASTCCVAVTTTPMTCGLFTCPGEMVKLPNYDSAICPKEGCKDTCCRTTTTPAPTTTLGTCASFTCPATMDTRPFAGNIVCPATPGCTAPHCCLTRTTTPKARQTCATFACAAGSKLRQRPEFVYCEDAGCSQKQCCLEANPCTTAMPQTPAPEPCTTAIPVRRERLYADQHGESAAGVQKFVAKQDSQEAVRAERSWALPMVGCFAMVSLVAGVYLRFGRRALRSTRAINTAGADPEASAGEFEPMLESGPEEPRSTSRSMLLEPHVQE
jgi:hypothetical protein